MYSVPYIQYPISYNIYLKKSLKLIKEAIQDEENDELFYDYLIKIAPLKKEKQIIESIRNDERKHNKMFRKIYKDFTSIDITAIENKTFKKPKSYLNGIEKALFGELSAVEKYRDIRAGLPNKFYRDMVFEILTDELKHADKYNYILNLNKFKSKTHIRNSMYFEPIIMPRINFTSQEALYIANQLGIDFNKEKFDLEQFKIGLDVELEHGTKDPTTNVTNDDPILTGKIALAHLREFPDYYTRLLELEKEAKAYWNMMK